MKILGFCLKQPKLDQTSENYTPKRDNEHPNLLHTGVSPSPCPQEQKSQKHQTKRKSAVEKDHIFDGLFLLQEI